jgi:hypothetical protein
MRSKGDSWINGEIYQLKNNGALNNRCVTVGAILLSGSHRGMLQINCQNEGFHKSLLFL